MPQRIELRERKSHLPGWTRRGATVLALLLAACSPDSGTTVPEGVSAKGTMPGANPPTSVKPVARATAAAGGARTVEEENERYSFHYSWPDAAGRIPALAALLDARLDADRAELKAQTAQAQKDAQAEGFPWRPYDRSTAWAVITDLPDWLSLSADLYQYSGGAHGMATFDSLVWDKRKGAARAPLDLFSSPDALEAAIKPQFCTLLDRQRAAKRGAEESRAGGGLFDECITLASTTVILGSSNSRTFDRIGFLIPPYEAGPYAEGTYEVTMPVTARIIAAVRPEYRESFTAPR